jgi:hypothetical protein
LFAWRIDEREAKVNGRILKIVLIAIKRSLDWGFGGSERSHGRNRRRPAGSGSQRRAIIVPSTIFGTQPNLQDTAKTAVVNGLAPPAATQAAFSF